MWLAAIQLPATWNGAAERSGVLAATRLALRALVDAAVRPRDRCAEDVAEAPAAEVVWHAHRVDASRCYAATRSGGWRCRLVSGFAARDERWIVHALAMLPGERHGDDGEAVG